MIETRSFDGDSAQLATFCTTVWRKCYEGKMPLALWSGPWMEWDLFGDEALGRELIVAAYDGARLVGVLPSKSVAYQHGGKRLSGTLGSYFSVDPDYAQRGVSMKLYLEQRRRLRALGLRMNMGFVYMGSAAGKGKEFWLKLTKTVTPIRKVGLWARPLDHRAVSRFEMSWRDRWGTRLLGCVQRPPSAGSNGVAVRPYQSEDLTDCVRLVRRLSESADFGQCWDRATLGRQLQFKDVVRTVVAVQDGRVGGLINYAVLDLFGKAVMRAGVIDLLCVDELPRNKRAAFLSAALQQMQRDGIHVALVLRTGCFGKYPLLANGFVPMPRDHVYVAQPLDCDVDPTQMRRLCVQWR